jgi:GntR family transcriptional regulator
MLILVDPHSGVPVYRQLMDQIKFHIASGVLRPGDELPSTRMLSSELGVNPMTISKAYSFLERDQVVERRPGRPLVVRELPTAQVQDRKIDQLRESLTAPAKVVRQLGIEPEEALRVFRGLLVNRSGVAAAEPTREGPDPTQLESTEENRTGKPGSEGDE